MNKASALFFGSVVHSRHRPAEHSLRYRVFSLLIDLDEIETLGRSLRLFGYNRRAVFSFHDADHGLGDTGGLRRWIEENLRQAGITASGIRIAVLCYPRILGYVFNPLTVYFCRSSDGTLQAILYEVCNTFHERHTYVIPVREGRADNDGSVRHDCAKQMYVSPFVPMNCRYRFRIMPPDETVLVSINEYDSEGALLHASFAGKRAPLTDGMLLRAFATYPLMTLKVTAAIHWEAFKLWLKGIPVHRHRRSDERVARTIVKPDTRKGGERI